MPTRPSIALEQFQIQTPCTEDWSGMHGDEAKRFCDKCNKHVHDLAHVDRAEANALLNQQTAGHVCVRMARDSAGQVITRDYWKFAAGAALAATVGLSGCDKAGNALESMLHAAGITTRKGGARPAMTGSPSAPPPVVAPPAAMGEACAPAPPKPLPEPATQLQGDVCVPPPPAPQEIMGKVCPPQKPLPMPDAPPLTGSPVPVPPPESKP